MKLIQEKFNEVTVVTLKGDVLDASVVGDFKNEMTPILKSEYHVVFEMSNIQFVDSSGIGAILSCLRTLNAEGGDLKICSLTRPVMALFELVRMHKIFDIFENKELAIESFSQQ
jgi:anti-sigma B factor antagonist